MELQQATAQIAGTKAELPDLTPFLDADEKTRDDVEIHRLGLEEELKNTVDMAVSGTLRALNCWRLNLMEFSARDGRC